MKNNRSDKFMLKYHNDMNIVKFEDFSQRELNIFFSICSVMAEQKSDTVTIEFNKIKKITDTFFRNDKELVEYIKSTNEKFQKLNGAFQNGDEYIQFVLFPTFRTNEKERTLSVQVNKEFAYILNEVTKNFTIFELYEFNSLKSTYSKHLFRLLKQWKSIGLLKISVDEFKRLLDVPKSYRMTNINQRILKPVLEELAPYFKGLSLGKIKDGRSVKYLVFSFEQQNSIKNNLQEKEIYCPFCNELLQGIRTKEGIDFLGHKNYKTASCKATFSNIEEIEDYKKKQEQRFLLMEQQSFGESIESENIEETLFWQEYTRKKKS